MFVGLGGCSRQREMSLRGSWSGYYLCPASKSGTECEASIMCGSVTTGGMGDVWGGTSAVGPLTLMFKS